MAQVVSRLFGGLGNQLFQYATARAVSLRTGAELLIDTRDTDAKGSHWRYALHHFKIKGRRADPAELPPGRAAQPLRYAWWRYAGGTPRFLRESGLGVNDTVLNTGPDVYLHGYFQSERYFAQAEAQLREELDFATPPSQQNSEWLSHIASVPAVSLHVRRGDYLTHGSPHPACDQDYYERALAHIAERMSEPPVVFVFSDEPGWARDNLHLGVEMHISDHNDAAAAYEDMRLIRACRHNITANSTFSWWGSWLNPSAEKIVVAPKNWFGKAGMSNPDIIPASWTQI